MWGNAYVLKLKDVPIVEFRFAPLGNAQTGISWSVVDVRILHEKWQSLIPVGMRPSEQRHPGNGFFFGRHDVYSWFRNRIVPQNRQFVKEIFSSLGLEYSNLKGIVDVSKCLSLTDSYWVVPEGFSGTFAEYNLYGDTPAP